MAAKSGLTALADGGALTEQSVATQQGAAPREAPPAAEHEPSLRRPSALSQSVAEGEAPEPLHVTTSGAQLAECEHMLLYLTAQTWTSGAASSVRPRRSDRPLPRPLARRTTPWW